MATAKSVGNLIGEPFEDYVNNQIRRRQIIQGKPERSLDEIQYLSNRNAWIKLASGVSIEEERLNLLKKNGNSLITDANITTGKDLAINYVLFNGLSNFEGKKPLQRSGVKNLSNNPNPVYGVGGTDFGYSPMPGITDMEFRCLNRGSIKKATLNIKAHNREQFDIIDVLYLRLGYSVFIEWGYDKYIDNKGKLQQMNETLIDKKFWSSKYNKSDYSEWLPEIEKKRKETDGNYDGAFGTVSNFSWDFASDGTYNIKVEIISLGDVVESLRVDLPPTYPPDLSPLLANNFSSLLRNNPDDDVAESVFYGTLYKGLDEVIENWYNDRTTTPPIISGVNDFFDTSTSFNIFVTKNGLWGPQATVTDYIGFNNYVNPLFLAGEELFEVTAEDIKTALEFSLVHSLVKQPDGEYKENFTRVSTFDDSNAVSYGWYGSRYFTEGPGTDQIYGDTEYFKNSTFFTNQNKLTGQFQPIELGQGTSQFSYIPLPKDNPTTSELNGISHSSTYIKNQKGTTSFKNIQAFLNPIESGSIFTSPNGNQYKLGLVSSQTSIQQKGKYRISTTPLKGRKVWSDNYNKIRGNTQAAWDYLLDAEIDGVRFSPDLAYIKMAVYNYFRLRGRAKPIPVTKKSFLAAADPDDFDLQQEALEEKKDLQKKNLNRIYRFFYDIRTKNKSSNPDPFIRKTLGNVNFRGIVKVFNEIEFGNYVEAKDGSNVVIHLTGMGNLTENYFIRLDYFLQFLQERIIPKIETTGDSKPMITFDGISSNGIDPEMKEKTICYVIDNLISLDIRKLIIANPFFIRGLSDPTNASSIIPQPLFPEGLDEFLEQPSGDRLFYGKIMNIYFNFSRLEEIFDSNDTTDPVVLFKALKTICDDINDALGGINNIEPIVNENNVIKFIDQTPIPGLNSIAPKIGINNFIKDDEAVLEIYGYNKNNPNKQTSNFVTNIGISTQIDKNYATAITIGATANGGVPGIEATAFSKWNRGITDRFKNNLTDAADDQPQVAFTASVPYKNTRNTYAEFLNQDFSIIGLNDDEDHAINENFIKFNKQSASSWYKTMQTANSIEGNGATESSIGFLPFNLKIDLDGISGIKIYNRVQVNSSFLPSNYPNTLEFIITQVNHKLSANGWSTSLETIATAKNQKI